MRRSPAEIALSLGVLALGVGVAAVTATLPSEGGYAGIGPNFIPGVVGAGIVLLGLWLGYEGFTGGWRKAAPDDPRARGELAFAAAACAWISAGVFARGGLIGWAGKGIGEPAAGLLGSACMRVNGKGLSSYRMRPSRLGPALCFLLPRRPT